VLLLDALTKLLPPPENPSHGDGNWDQTAEILGTSLPSDYVALLRLYGTGGFADEIMLASPFVTDNSAHDLAAHLNFLQLLRKNGVLEGPPEPKSILPVPIFPEVGGLLPFAIDGSGIYYAWRTWGATPDNWVTAVYNIRDDAPEEFQLGALELLHGILSRTLKWSNAEDKSFPPPRSSRRFKFFPWSG